jgi:hypothetical protein
MLSSTMRWPRIPGAAAARPTGAPARAGARTPDDALEQPASPAATLIQLQRSAGNRAVTAAVGVLQRKVDPEDVAAEMVGRSFELGEEVTSGATKLAAGERVTVVSWSNAATVVRVRSAAGVEVDVPKKLLKPVGSGVAGIAPYGVGLGKVVGDFERGEQAIEKEKARKGGARAKELLRLQGLQANRERLLNRRLIQAAMMNRFDGSIRTWVDYYNQVHGYTKVLGQAEKGSLDPNLVKAMIFQETQMGTSGEHLADPAETDPKVKTRQNLGQVIDSSAAALLLMIKEEEPGLITKHGLQNLQRDAAASGDAESHMWGEPGFVAAVTEYFADVAAGSPEKNVDYDFWIKAAVRWLFLKRKSVGSWKEAVRAYNGGGQRARDYRDAVTRRAAEAVTQEKAGKEFVPDRL